MKVLHIAESAQGGVGTYLAEILPDQARLLGADNVRALLPDKHSAHVSGVDRHLIATWRRSGRSIMELFTLAAAIRREVAAFRPTIIHAHSSVAGGVVRLLYGWRSRRFGIVYCPHGWAFDRRSRGLKSRVIERVEGLLAKIADRIVVISDYERRAGLRIGIPTEGIDLVMNGIADQPSSRSAVWTDDRLKVLFVGRLDEQKGFDTLLDAVEPLRDRVSLRVVGKAIAGPTSKRRGNRRQVDYLGWRSLSEISTEIAAADVVAIPSRWEGFGLVALEAMRGGCAVIASAVGGLREIVVDRDTGRLVDPDNPEQLMRVLMEHDREAWHKMGAAGRARFVEKFTSARMNHELLTLYRLLDDRRALVPAHGLAAHA